MLRKLLGRRHEEASVAVIGAGFAGIGVAVRLKKAGFDRVTLLEKAAGPGGTWWHNTYAGAEVDTPSILYSYSWMPWKWTRTHVRQAELQGYPAAVLEKFHLGERVCYGVEVQRVQWHEDRQEYTLHGPDGQIMAAKHVVSAVCSATRSCRTCRASTPSPARCSTPRSGTRRSSPRASGSALWDRARRRRSWCPRCRRTPSRS